MSPNKKISFLRITVMRFSVLFICKFYCLCIGIARQDFIIYVDMYMTIEISKIFEKYRKKVFYLIIQYKKCRDQCSSNDVITEDKT